MKILQTVFLFLFLFTQLDAQNEMFWTNFRDKSISHINQNGHSEIIYKVDAREGYQMAIDEKQNLLIYYDSKSKRLIRSTYDLMDEIVILDNVVISSLDIHPSTKTIYASIYEADSLFHVYSMDYDGSNKVSLYNQSGIINDLTVNETQTTLYTTEDEIIGRIDIATGSHITIIANLDSPRGIELDEENGILFFSTNNPIPNKFNLYKLDLYTNTYILIDDNTSSRFAFDQVTNLIYAFDLHSIKVYNAIENTLINSVANSNIDNLPFDLSIDHEDGLIIGISPDCNFISLTSLDDISTTENAGIAENFHISDFTYNKEEHVFYISDSSCDKIYELDPETREIRDIVTDINTSYPLVIKLRFDHVNKKLIWENKEKIYRCNLDGTEIEVLFGENFYSSVTGFDIDHVNQKLYIGSSELLIYRMDLDGSNIETLADSFLESNFLTATSFKFNYQTNRIYFAGNKAMYEMDFAGNLIEMHEVDLDFSGGDLEYDALNEIFYTCPYWDNDIIYTLNKDFQIIDSIISNLPNIFIYGLELTSDFKLVAVNQGFDFETLCYPNPFSKELIFKTESSFSGTFEMFDMQGRLVYFKEGLFVERNVLELPDILPGNYILKAIDSSSGKSSTYRLIKIE